MNGYVLDACALLAVLNGENGAEPVKSIIEQANSESLKIRMSIINLLEVYCGKEKSLDITGITADSIKVFFC